MFYYKTIIRFAENNVNPINNDPKVFIIYYLEYINVDELKIYTNGIVFLVGTH